MPANISINFNSSQAETISGLLEGKFASSDQVSLAKNFSAGDGDHQVDCIFERRAAAAVVPEEIDLSDFNDTSGAAAAFATVKGLIVANRGAENPLSVGGSYLGANAAVTLPPGGALVLLLPLGIDIESGVNDTLSIGSANGTDYECRIIGVKDPEITEE